MSSGHRELSVSLRTFIVLPDRSKILCHARLLSIVLEATELPASLSLSPLPSSLQSIRFMNMLPLSTFLVVDELASSLTLSARMDDDDEAFQKTPKSNLKIYWNYQCVPVVRGIIILLKTP